MKDYIKILEDYSEDMIEDLKSILRIKSVAVETEGEYPFGEGVQKVFETVLDMAEKDGFTTKNVDNYGGHIEFKGEGEGLLGVVGHLDVVPEGSGWKTDPYDPQIIDGKLYARGSIDDKGPTMAGYYAMKALKDAGFKPKKDIRLIIGLDEETNWKGMEYYLKREKMPDMGFSPDADFPLIHCEKGLLIFDIMSKIDNSANGLKLLSFTGGSAPNMVADSAEAIVNEDISDVVSKYVEKTGYDVSISKDGENFKILAKGVTAHGAQPFKGTNAISIMFKLFDDVKFASDDVNKMVEFYNKHISFNCYGEEIGCDLNDEPSGRLIFNVGIFNFTGEDFKLTINIRYPATLDEKIVYSGINEILGKYSYTLEELDHLKPLYVPKDSELIQTLMSVYQKHTGDMETEPIVVGGATYARAVNNSVAFGALFPGEDEVEHQANEYVNIDSLKKAAKIYADAIYELAK